jgi:hypothetical protein
MGMGPTFLFTWAQGRLRIPGGGPNEAAGREENGARLFFFFGSLLYSTLLRVHILRQIPRWEAWTGFELCC